MSAEPNLPLPADLRPLPHAQGPEKSVLSSMLQEPREYIGLALEECLTAGHFYQPGHAALFGILVSRMDHGLPVELVSLTQELNEKGLLEKIGGPAAMVDLYTYAPSPGHFRYHLKLLKEKYTLRSLLAACASIEEGVWDQAESVSEVLDQAEKSIMEIREGVEATTIEGVREAVEWVIGDFIDRHNGKTEVLGLSTGYPYLDRLTGGLKGPDLIVIAARPSMGKTSLMMNIVEHVALDLRAPVLVFSCEMSRRQIVHRMTFSRARFDSATVSQGYKPEQDELDRIKAAAHEIRDSPLVIDETEGITISQLRAKARRKKRELGIKLIAVDYLQLLRGVSKQSLGSREREISEISAGLKAMAKELDVPVIVLAQLNRAAESRTGSLPGLPRMSDLRESGSIEQDADIVGLLYRSAYYASSEEAKKEAGGTSRLEIAKNRNGATGLVPLDFISAHARFETVVPRENEEEVRGESKRAAFQGMR